MSVLSLQLRTRVAAVAESSEQKKLPSCGLHQVCEPTGMRVERVLLFEGPREVEVIEDCHCEIKLTQCIRVPALRTFYAETPYETVIDVGGCSRFKGSPGAFVTPRCTNMNVYSVVYEQ